MLICKNFSIEALQLEPLYHDHHDIKFLVNLFLWDVKYLMALNMPPACCLDAQNHRNADMFLLDIKSIKKA